MGMHSFDYIVVGGGSAGCVVASRLSEDPDVSVCLLEAGRADKSSVIHAPAGAAVMLPSKINNWALNTTPQPGLNGRCGYQPRGKTLGGSSSINAMMYCRGHRWDYDHWASLGNQGWAYDDVLEYFKRSENNENHDDEFHGRGGPLNVTNLKSPSQLNQLFLQGCEENGIPRNNDINGAEQLGAMVTQVTQKNGERHSTAKGFLTPNLDRPNLHVITSALTSKLIVESGRVVAVEYVVGKQRFLLRAKREVILSAGAFGSPQILMLSGIGPQQQLVEKGITPILDLPGVGENLQDHPDVIITYRAPSNSDTFGISVRGSLAMAQAIPQWVGQREGKITSNFAEGIAFACSTPEVSIPDLELIFVVGMVDDHARKMHMGHGFSCHATVLRPKSRGWVRLNSNDPHDPPLINPNFLGEDEDLELLVKGWQLQKRVLEAKAFDAWRGEPLYPVDASDPNAVIGYVRSKTDTQYHPVGTCKMGPDSDAMAVVDQRLRVKGIAGLRVVDASIMPTLIGGNTNAPTVMIAEKAADMIKQDHTAGVV